MPAHAGNKLTAA